MQMFNSPNKQGSTNTTIVIVWIITNHIHVHKIVFKSNAILHSSTVYTGTNLGCAKIAASVCAVSVILYEWWCTIRLLDYGCEPSSLCISEKHCDGISLDTQTVVQTNAQGCLHSMQAFSDCFPQFECLDYILMYFYLH